MSGFVVVVIAVVVVACLLEETLVMYEDTPIYPLSGKLVRKVWGSGKVSESSSSHPPPPPRSATFSRAGAASRPACNFKTPTLKKYISCVRHWTTLVLKIVGLQKYEVEKLSRGHTVVCYNLIKACGRRIVKRDLRFMNHIFKRYKVLE